MKGQKRICQWLGLPNCTHLRTFLDLPLPVRRQIYLYSGLFIGGAIHLRLHVDNSDEDDDTDYDEDSESLYFIFNVLQTCKAINREVTDIIYSENCLRVSSDDLDEGLILLGRFKPSTCLRLRHLVIDLFPYEECGYPLRGRRQGSSKQLKKSRKEYIQAWQRGITNILSHVEPRTLTLGLTCDENDIEAMEDIFQPFVAFPGILRDCAVSLSGRNDNTLYKLARQAVHNVTGKESHLGDKPFRFLELSVEIRQAILQYTDLVTPFCEVLWKPYRGFTARTLFDYCSEACQDPKLHHATRFFSCLVKEVEDGLPRLCNRQNGIYSSRCQCWVPPRSLFLVCRSMYADAVATFYSCNRIVVASSRGFSCEAAIPRLRLDGSRFITRFIWPNMLSHLRSLELVFSPFKPGNYLSPSDPAHADWRFAIDHLKAHGSIPALTVTVYMTNSVWRSGRDTFMRTVAKRNGNKTSLLRAHLCLLLPLRPLRHMKRFFVHLEWPWFWGPVAQPHKDDAHQFLLEAERWLEQRIMGTGYDSYSLGKREEIPGQWLMLVRHGIREYEEEQEDIIPEEAFQ